MGRGRAALTNGSLLAVALWLALPSPLRAATPSQPAASIEIDGERVLLPRELGQYAAPASPSAFGPERTVVIGWRVRERSSFQGYRVTAVLDGGPLSGAVVRWHVDTIEGRVEVDGAHTYGVRLPFEIGPGTRVRAAVEALLDDGRGVLLATRVASPAVQPATGQAWYPRRVAHPREVRLLGVAPVFLSPGLALTLVEPSVQAMSSRQQRHFHFRPTGPRPRGPPLELSPALAA